RTAHLSDTQAGNGAQRLHDRVLIAALDLFYVNYGDRLGRLVDRLCRTAGGNHHMLVNSTGMESNLECPVFLRSEAQAFYLPSEAARLSLDQVLAGVEL